MTPNAKRVAPFDSRRSRRGVGDIGTTPERPGLEEVVLAVRSRSSCRRRGNVSFLGEPCVAYTTGFKEERAQHPVEHAWYFSFDLRRNRRDVGDVGDVGTISERRGLKKVAIGVVDFPS